MKYGNTRRLRRSKAAARSRQRLNDTPTPAEAALARALDDLGIRHTTNYRVNTAESLAGYYLVDFHLPAQRMFIELDGKPHTSLQAQWNDRLRTEAILKVHTRHHLIRAWNKDVLKNPHAWIASHVQRSPDNPTTMPRADTYRLAGTLCDSEWSSPVETGAEHTQQ